MDRPLDGLRVVSLAHQYPGPFATMVLSDLGADVVLVEHPRGGDPARAFPGFHGALARGKRSVALDLKTTEGRAALEALLCRADVLMEGFRPGTMARLGFGREELAERHPHLVHVAISGYGQTGPYAQRPGHDLTYQAEAGMLYEHLPPADPPAPPSLALGDLVAGLLAVQSVLLGVLQRDRRGRGPMMDVSMFDGLVSLLAAHVGPVVNGTGPPGFPYEPGYGVFPTADDGYLALGVAHEDHFWTALCDVAGLPEDRELGAAERFAQHERLRARLAAALRSRTADEWAEVLTAADVPFGRSRSLAELPNSPQARAREMFVRVAGPDGREQVHVRQPLVVDGTAPGPRSGVPGLGEHTREVLAEAGLAAEIIDAVEAVAAGTPATPGTGRPTPHR